VVGVTTCYSRPIASLSNSVIRVNNLQLVVDLVGLRRSVHVEDIFWNLGARL
jgi:hypothetical protein